MAKREAGDRRVSLSGDISTLEDLIPARDEAELDSEAKEWKIPVRGTTGIVLGSIWIRRDFTKALVSLWFRSEDGD